MNDGPCKIPDWPEVRKLLHPREYIVELEQRIADLTRERDDLAVRIDGAEVAEARRAREREALEHIVRECGALHKGPVAVEIARRVLADSEPAVKPGRIVAWHNLPSVASGGDTRLDDPKALIAMLEARLAQARADALEEAAKVAESNLDLTPGHIAIGSKRHAAAIRALTDTEPAGRSDQMQQALRAAGISLEPGQGGLTVVNEPERVLTARLARAREALKRADVALDGLGVAKRDSVRDMIDLALADSEPAGRADQEGQL